MIEVYNIVLWQGLIVLPVKAIGASNEASKRQVQSKQKKKTFSRCCVASSLLRDVGEAESVHSLKGTLYKLKERKAAKGC